MLAAWGRVDVVVNNAGHAAPSTIERMTDDEWRETVDCNLSGTFYCCREAVREMRRGGRGGVIVNVGSSAARGLGRVEQGAYGSTKAGIHNLTETLALEGRPHRIFAYVMTNLSASVLLTRNGDLLICCGLTSFSHHVHLLGIPCSLLAYLATS